MPAAQSPSHTALRPTKKYRCARRALFLPPAQATCTEMYRRSFLAPSSPLSACPPSVSSHSTAGLLVSPTQNPTASLLLPLAQCFRALSPGARRRCDVPYRARQRFANRISAPVPTAAALSPAASPASRLRH